MFCACHALYNFIGIKDSEHFVRGNGSRTQLLLRGFNQTLNVASYSILIQYHYWSRLTGQARQLLMLLPCMSVEIALELFFLELFRVASCSKSLPSRDSHWVSSLPCSLTCAMAEVVPTLGALLASMRQKKDPGARTCLSICLRLKSRVELPVIGHMT